MSSAYASTMKPRGAPEKVNMAADQRMHTPRLMLRDVPVPEAASVRTVRPARPSLAMSSGNQEVTATASWRPLMGKRVIRFFSERRSSGLLALQVRSTRLVTTLRRTRAVAGDKAFTDCREVRPFMALARNTSGVGACPPM